MSKTHLITLLLWLLLCSVAAVGIYGYQGFLIAPVVQRQLLLVVPQGAGISGIRRQVAPQPGVLGELYWKVVGRVHPLAAEIKVGEYRIQEGLSPQQLLSLLASGKVLQHAITLLEGWTFRQVRSALAADESLAHTIEELTAEEICNKVDEELANPEGWFFPETYYYTKGDSDVDILRRAYRRTERNLAEVWAQRADDIELETPFDALKLASIIEKETQVAAERREVSGVFHRRLAKGMRLQTDPTVIYGLGEAYDGNLRRSDLRRDTPYNTYTRYGLPPTPIALAGFDALLAAVQPNPGETLYFVANGRGGHTFSATFSEHRKAVKALLARQRGGGAG